MIFDYVCINAYTFMQLFCHSVAPHPVLFVISPVGATVLNLWQKGGKSHRQSQITNHTKTHKMIPVHIGMTDVSSWLVPCCWNYMGQAVDTSCASYLSFPPNPRCQYCCVITLQHYWLQLILAFEHYKPDVGSSHWKKAIPHTVLTVGLICWAVCAWQVTHTTALSLSQSSAAAEQTSCLTKRVTRLTHSWQ